MMDVVLGALLGIGTAATIAAAAWRFVRPDGRVNEPAAGGMQAALHAASATLPHLRGGLTPRTAAKAVPYLRALTGCAAVALADTEAVLAIDGKGREQVRPGDLMHRLLAQTGDDRLHVIPRLVSSDPGCPLRAAVLAPLFVQGRRAGTLIAFYGSSRQIRRHEVRVVQEAATLVSAQVELSVLDEQEERLARAELRSLRAQISPHFIYNALAAIAGEIHARPDDARELLTEFAEFTRYLFREQRSYVALADELDHVERYLRLEQARFRDRLQVHVDVAPGARGVVVPSLSIQPLVENAVRHGAETHDGAVRILIEALDVGADVEVRVIDDGPGIEPDRVAGLLAGAGGGIGLANVDRRLRATFGEDRGLRITTELGAGTTVAMLVPKLRAHTVARAA
jgi:two-component system LytT family sensor kinase